MLIAPNRPPGYKEVYELVKDVITRWLSFVDSAERALYLKPAIDELLLEEKVKYEEYCHRCTQGNRLVLKDPPPILSDALTANDWNVIKLYCDILKPVKEAVKMLQGRAGGRFGAIWQVLPAYEKLLRHFEQLVNQYLGKGSLSQSNHSSALLAAFNEELSDVATAVATQSDEYTTAEHNLGINIKLAWQKLNEYYSKLDGNPVYVAAIVLHPRLKWQYLERRWQERPNWIMAAKKTFNQLTLEY
jgi:hypothetical protein